MALDFQNAAVQFTKGLDTRTQEKIVIPSKWNKLDNLTLAENQTPKRRDGVTTLVGSRTGNGLATYAQQLLAVNGPDVYSISKALGTANLCSGRHGYVGVSKKEVVRNVGMQDTIDVAVGSTGGGSSGNLTCYVWRDKTGGAVVTGVNVLLVDESTSTVLIANTQMRTNAGVFCPRVVFCANAMGSGGTFYIFYMQGTSLYCRTIRTSSPTTLGAEVALITSASLANINFDCCAFGTTGGNTTAMVSYGWADGATSVRTIQVTHAAGVPSITAGPTNLITEANQPIATVSGICCIPFSSTLGATYIIASAGGVYGGGTAGATINTSWALQTAASIYGATAPPTAGQCHITAVNDGTYSHIFSDCRSSWGNAVNNVLYHLVSDSTVILNDVGAMCYSADFGGAATDPSGPRGPYISGKAFYSTGRVFLPTEVLENYQGAGATHPSNNQQNSFFLWEIQGGIVSTPAGVVVAKALYGAVGVAQINNNAPGVGTPCSTPSLGDGTFAYACTERTLLSFVGGFNVSPTGIVRLTLAPNFSNGLVKAQLGESTYIAGGSLTDYSGQQPTEHPFLMFPEGISLELVAAGGAMTAGTHQVVVIYEFIDAAGQRHQSAPSLPVSMTVAANDRIRVRVPTLHIGQMNSGNGSVIVGCKIVAYITQANGLTFNRVASTAAGASGTDNDVSVAYVTLPLIDAADATYALNELLYNQPNQSNTTLPNLSPPPCSGLAQHDKRIWFDCADQPGSYGYSQQYANNLGLQFNPALGGTWPTEGGDFRGFCSMDEKLILFCSERLYVIYGSGPNAAGNYSNYSQPQEIPSDVGCSDARSILKMPKGIMFKSAKGFYLLGRDLTVDYIGEGVEDFDSYTITSAVLLKDRQECRFGTNSSTHPQLVYSYLGEGEWTTNSYLDTYTTRDAVWWPLQAQYVAIDGSYGLQTDWSTKYDSFAGAAKAIYWTARTAFLHLAEIGGFQRVRWVLLSGTGQTGNPMGGNSPQSDLVWNVYLNDTYTTAAYSFTVDLNTISFPSPIDTVDLRHKVETQKCKSIAFQWSDQPSTSEAQNGYQVDGIQALTLNVGLKRGTMRLPAAQGVS